MSTSTDTVDSDASIHKRAVSSAGERFVDIEEVTGSIPVQPISKKSCAPMRTGLFLFMNNINLLEIVSSECHLVILKRVTKPSFLLSPNQSTECSFTSNTISL